MFYDFSWVIARFALFGLIYAIIQFKEAMLPSPKSSLSSFRDYYQHSSENTPSGNRLEDSIDIGFRNFQVSKLLEKLDLGMQQKLYWSVFYSFRKIHMRNTFGQRRMAAAQKLRGVLARQNKRDFKYQGKRLFLNELLCNVQFQRKRELQILLNVAISLAAKLRQIMGQGYYAICRTKVKEKTELTKEKLRYIRKLSKALLSITFRNLMQKKIKQTFEQLKYTQAQENSKNSIRFFKPKKGRQVYEHKVDQKLSKLSNFIFLFKALAKRIRNTWQVSFLRLCKYGRSKVVEPEADSLEIMNNAVKHLVYLTAKENSISNRQNQVSTKIKAIKLQSLAMRVGRRQRRTIRQCVWRWRDATIEDKRELGEEIERLLLLKQQILEDM